MIWLLVGAILFFVTLLAAQALLWVTPAKLAQIVRYMGASLLTLLALIAWIRGFGALGASLVAAACVLLGISEPLNINSILTRLGLRHNFEGQRSRIETATLSVTIDLASGDMDGQVKRGSFTGRTLSLMNNTDLMRLLDSCLRVDPEAAALIQTFLRRYRRGTYEGAGHKRYEDGGYGEGAGAGGFASGNMSPTEAYNILGLEPGASRQEIKRAYKALIRKVHPDQGGSTYLASKINQAKDCLLGN